MFNMASKLSENNNFNIIFLFNKTEYSNSTFEAKKNVFLRKFRKE